MGKKEKDPIHELLSESNLPDAIKAAMAELLNNPQAEPLHDVDNVMKALINAKPEFLSAFLRLMAIREVQVDRNTLEKMDRLATAHLLAERTKENIEAGIFKMKDEFLVVEEDFIRKGLISWELNFKQNLADRNKQRLAGALHLLINNGYIIIDEKNRTESVKYVLNFFIRRYNLNNLQEFYKKEKDQYIELARERFPVIEGIIRDRAAFMPAKKRRSPVKETSI